MTSRRVAVLQSNYIPWKGYFDIINDVDLFVFYDDVQFTKNDWRNRNRIKGPDGLQWMTIPAGDRLDRLVCEVELPDSRWQARHWRTLQQNYGKCPHFARYRSLLEEVYLGRSWSHLSDLNHFLIRTIATELLQSRTAFADSRAYAARGEKLDRLLDLLVKAGATSYLSGPSARAYIEPARFAEIGIELQWKSYAGYPEYRQRFPPFEHAVSILDLLFNVGPDAPAYIWGWRQAGSGRADR